MRGNGSMNPLGLGDLMGVNLTGVKQTKGKLRALYQTKLGKGGYYWMCECECGANREVLAKRFSTCEIRSCIDCRIRPASDQVQYRRADWYTDDWQGNSWRKFVRDMPFERRLLMETYLVGKPNRHWQFQKQAAQIAYLDKNPIEELKCFSLKRVASAMTFLKSRGITPNLQTENINAK